VSLVEDTLNFVEAHVDEVLSFYLNLGVAVGRAARRFNTVNDRGFIVEECSSFRAKLGAISFISDEKRNWTREVHFRRKAFNLRGIDEFSTSFNGAVLADDLLISHEFFASDDGDSASTCRSFSRSDIVNLRRFEVVVGDVIVSRILPIQSDFDLSFVELSRVGRSFTVSQSRS
jgi:hypothetical protein